MAVVHRPLPSYTFPIAIVNLPETPCRPGKFSGRLIMLCIDYLHYDEEQISTLQHTKYVYA